MPEIINHIGDIHQLQTVLSNSSLEFIARHVVEGFITGLHRSPFHGFSVEFAEHRIYNPGESTRFIDWKILARTERMYIKCFEEETNLRAHLIIDNSSSMLFPYTEGKDKKNIPYQTKLAFAIYCAGSLVYLLRKQRDAVGLTVFSDTIEQHTEARLSLLHSKMIFNKLENLLSFQNRQLKKRTLASQLLHQIADNIHKRSLVILFSDMMDSENTQDFFSALQHLRYNKHEIIIFQIQDEKLEEKLEYQNRPYKFIDMETGTEVRLNPNEVRTDYSARMKDYKNQVKLKCGQYQIDLIECNINSHFRDILIPYLIKRQKLF